LSQHGKKILVLLFWEWCHKWGRFLAIFTQITWPWAQTSRLGVSKLFCPGTTQAITQQSEGQKSYVMSLLQDMLHSDKQVFCTFIPF